MSVTGKRILSSTTPSLASEIPVYTYTDDKQAKKVDIDRLSWNSKKAEELAKRLQTKPPPSRKSGAAPATKAKAVIPKAVGLAQEKTPRQRYFYLFKLM